MRSLRLLCPTRVVRPNWKAECVERRPLRLERGKGCEALPIATFHPPPSPHAGRTPAHAADWLRLRLMGNIVGRLRRRLCRMDSG